LSKASGKSCDRWANWRTCYSIKIVVSFWRLRRFPKVEAAIFSHHLYAESAEREEQKVRSYEDRFDVPLKMDITTAEEKKREEAPGPIQSFHERGSAWAFYLLLGHVRGQPKSLP
jgi:hypothetical protein